MFILVVDAHSKWPKTFNMKQCTKADKVVAVFKEIFSRVGLPNLVVSNSSLQYKSGEFKTFLKRNGISHSYTPPYNPASNSAAI